MVPAASQERIYSSDGTLASDGLWNYVFDGELRLVEMETHTNALAAGAPRQKLVFANDWQSRRISKTVSNWTGGAWALEYQRKFLYDGWNLLAELDATNGLAASYAWGLDASGTMQGAGGVGGLLIGNFHSTNSVSSYFPAYDGNHNIIAQIDAQAATPSAIYEYGPFAEDLRQQGPLAKINPFRFSTKYQDNETRLRYYGQRYLQDDRWLSRDPIEEKGGLNLYGFIHNDSLNRLDSVGLSPIAALGPNAGQLLGIQGPKPPSQGFSIPRPTLFYWSAALCPGSQKTAFIQVGFSSKGAFVDDGTHCPLSASPICPPLYPASNKNWFEDTPGSAIGWSPFLPASGIKFIVCRVCLEPCEGKFTYYKPGHRVKSCQSGWKVVSAGPCRVFHFPMTGGDLDLDSSAFEKHISPPAEYRAQVGSFLDGKCFGCLRKNDTVNF